MRTLMPVLVLAVFGCNAPAQPVASEVQVQSAPNLTVPTSTPTTDPAPSPSVTPTPSATPSPAPSASPSAGPYTCEVEADTHAQCSDGVTTWTSTYSGYVAVAQGSELNCALQDPDGNPTDCTNLEDGGCTNPPLDAALYCWAQGDTEEVLLNTQPFSNFAAPGYAVGPLSISASGGQVCVKISAYYELTPNPPAHLYDFAEHEQLCGTTRTGSWSQEVEP